MDAGGTAVGLLSLQVRPGHPEFLDLPWHLPLAEWAGACARVVQLPRGLSRHEVLFVSYGAAVYALKELPAAVAEHEYDVLTLLEERRLPAVIPVGRAHVRRNGGEDGGVLVTRFLDGALPYRTLFQNPGLRRYRERLLDAMAGLLVRLHLAGFYWGDCSLSNALFRSFYFDVIACGCWCRNRLTLFFQSHYRTLPAVASSSVASYLSRFTPCREGEDRLRRQFR